MGRFNLQVLKRNFLLASLTSFRSVHVAVNQTITPVTVSVEGIDCLWFTSSVIDFFPNPAYYGLGPAGVLNLTSAFQGMPTRPCPCPLLIRSLQALPSLSPNPTSSTPIPTTLAS